MTPGRGMFICKYNFLQKVWILIINLNVRTVSVIVDFLALMLVPFENGQGVVSLR